jgi:hypothetical protein
MSARILRMVAILVLISSSFQTGNSGNFSPQPRSLAIWTWRPCSQATAQSCRSLAIGRSSAWLRRDLHSGMGLVADTSHTRCGSIVIPSRGWKALIDKFVQGFKGRPALFSSRPIVPAQPFDYSPWRLRRRVEAGRSKHGWWRRAVEPACPTVSSTPEGSSPACIHPHVSGIREMGNLRGAVVQSNWYW